MKVAVILLIVTALFLSTAVTAETVKIEGKKDTIRTTNPNPAEPNIENKLGPILFSQRPYQPNENWGFYLSDIQSGFRHMDDFWDITEDICDLHWWGLSLIRDGANWVNSDPSGMKFEILFYDNTGTPVCSYSNVEPIAVSTGLFYSGKEMFFWEYDLEPCCPTNIGWISIVSISSPYNSLFFWAGSPEGNWNAQENWVPIDPPENLAFDLTGCCVPVVDVEKYIKDPKTGEWFDADTPNSAHGIVVGQSADFKIVIYNDGDCPLYNIAVLDTMRDGFDFSSAVPDPDSIDIEPPYYHFTWVFPGPLSPGDTIEINMYTTVEGPENELLDNSVEVLAFDDNGAPTFDDDFCYAMSKEKSRSINMPFLNWLHSHPILYQILLRFLRL